jgi:excisionase family DNA binding protein
MRPRVVDDISVSTPLDPWLSLRAAATYTSLSIRTLRKWLTDPDCPLPYYPVGGKILLRRSELDKWITAFRQAGNFQRDTLDQIVEDALLGFRSKT